METYETEQVAISDKLVTIVERLAELDRHIDRLVTRVAALDEAGVCTGVAYWRDRDDSTPKLYANHGVGVSCPLHGEPEDGRRLRVYVGSDPEAQQEALAAIERRQQKARLEAQMRQLAMQQDRIEQAVTDAWRAAAGLQRHEW
jgi:hypothetical protein